MIKTLHIALIGLAITFTNSRAEFRLRLAPAPDDPGTSSMPAKVGYSYSKNGDGVFGQVSLAYDGQFASENAIYEPFVALNANENPSTGSRDASLELGNHSIFGDITTGSSFLVDLSVAGEFDGKSKAANIKTTFSAEPVIEWLKIGTGYNGKFGMFARPSIALYQLHTFKTDDSIKAPLGGAIGGSLTFAFDIFPPTTERIKLTVTGDLSKDLFAYEDRLPSFYPSGKLNAMYSFYDPKKPPKNSALISIGISGQHGIGKLSTSKNYDPKFNVYLGVKV